VILLKKLKKIEKLKFAYILWMQIAMPNLILEGSSRGVLKTSEHFLFKTFAKFSSINFTVGGVAQNICLLSDYLRSCQIFGAISPTIQSINKNKAF
jgi:hypothetical protein